MTIAIARDSYTRHAEPYVWYDDSHGEPGWVLRYSLSQDIGQTHLDEPIDVEDEDADDATLRAAAEWTLKCLGWGK